MKHALAVASLVLVAGTSAACGGGEGGGAPSDASEKDFCGTFTDFYAAVQELGEDASDADFIKEIKTVGEELAKTGTPEDIPDEARKGFELTIDMFEDLEDDATQADMDKVEDELSDEEKKQVDAFDTYVGDTCDEA